VAFIPRDQFPLLGIVPLIEGEGAEVVPPLPPVFLFADLPAVTAGFLVARGAQCLGIGERVSAASFNRDNVVGLPLMGHEGPNTAPDVVVSGTAAFADAPRTLPQRVNHGLRKGQWYHLLSRGSVYV